MSRVLVVDDDEGVRTFLVEALSDVGHEVTAATGGREALEIARRASFHVVVSDLKMPDLDGLGLLAALREASDDVEVILLTAHGTVETAVRAMKLGAFDYLEKPLQSPTALRLLVERAAERHRQRRHAEAFSRGETPELTWGAPSMEPVVRKLRKVAPTDATVLFLGESGTGKEVCARAVHAESPRRKAPFVAVNCAALSPSLLESELFGHERGAFTGAHARKLGRLELAEGGTFFLDEVGELDLAVQAKLLRVVQERAFERVGGHQTVKVDVRLLAATNRDLAKMVETGAFREDLYHRLSVFPVELPPLRERREDVVPLAKVLLARIAASLGRPELRLAPDAEEVLRAASLPGNARELANALERAAILSDDDVVRADDLSLAPRTGAGPSKPPGLPSMREAEREAIANALAHFGGNRRRVAEHLGIGLRTLYEKLRRYDLG